MGDTAEKGPSRSRTDEAPIKTTEAQRQSSKVVFAVAAYATCSASMLIVNKLCITYLPAPTMVLFLQLSFTALAIRAMTHAGIVDADPLDVEKAKPFVLVALALGAYLFLKSGSGDSDGSRRPGGGPRAPLGTQRPSLPGGPGGPGAGPAPGPESRRAAARPAGSTGRLCYYNALP